MIAYLLAALILPALGVVLVAALRADSTPHKGVRP